MSLNCLRTVRKALEVLQPVLADIPDWELALLMPLGLLVVYCMNGGGDLDYLRRAMEELQPVFAQVPVWRLMGAVARAAVELYLEVRIYQGRRSGGVEREDPRAPDVDEYGASGGGGTCHQSQDEETA